MGGAIAQVIKKKLIKGVINAVGGKDSKQARPAAPSPAEKEIAKAEPTMATQEEKAAAAKRRARAGSRRQLLSAGRLGTSDEGQTTLGA
tara:strand:- start:67 stop:333 length:267 start_codon:yes stop_codon:yes gene_type:complete